MALTERLGPLRFVQTLMLLAASALAAALSANDLSAQVVAAAKGADQSFWVGAEYSNMHASFPYGSSQRLSGASVFADINWNRSLGIEADARFLRFNSYAGEHESSYLVGPRYLFVRFGKFQPYAKALVGAGNIEYPFKIGSASYFAFAPGAGVRYRLSYRWSLRAEYEYQWWPGSPGFANQPQHPLKPDGFHLGLAYRPFR